MASPGVTLRGVTVIAGGEAVIEDVSFEAPAGATTVLLGATDSGAASTIKAIAGLARVNAGHILVGGADVTKARPGRRNVAIVFEGHTLFPHMTVFDNVAYPLKVAKVDPVEIGRRVGTIAERLGFSHVLDEKPRGVADGLRRRAGLARAIVRGPAAYLFDRLLASLDDDFRGAAREAIGFLREQGGATILLPSADGAEASRFADWLVVMADGRVLQQGPAEAVRRSPATLAVADRALARALAYCDGVVLAVRADGLSIRLDEGGALELALDPEGAEVGERITLAIDADKLAGRTWREVDPQVLIAFDSAGRALNARSRPD